MHEFVWIGRGHQSFFICLAHRYARGNRGQLDEVKGIVLHRTVSTTANGTLDSYKSGRKVVHYGAHFLIDTDGTVYVTADLDKYTLHVGKTRKKEHPNNSNSIGIEVVGMPLDENGDFTTDPTKVTSWQALTSEQIEAASKLVNF